MGETPGMRQRRNNSSLRIMDTQLTMNATGTTFTTRNKFGGVEEWGLYEVE